MSSGIDSSQDPTEFDKPLVVAILEDEYLNSFFWQEPTPVRAGKARKVKSEARTWYLESRWGLILDRVVERIDLLPPGAWSGDVCRQFEPSVRQTLLDHARALDARGDLGAK